MTPAYFVKANGTIWMTFEVFRALRADQLMSMLVRAKGRKPALHAATTNVPIHLQLRP